MTDIKDKIFEIILYAYYLVYFSKNSNNIEVLINFTNKVNIITYVYTLELGIYIQKTVIRIQGIDKSSLVYYKMIIAIF